MRKYTIYKIRILKGVVKMNKKELIKKLFSNEQCEYTSNLKATYYILPNGKQISFGYDYGSRSDDHRIIFSCFDDIKYNDWKKLINETGLLMYIPENNEAWTLPNVEITQLQEKFLKNNNIELIKSN